MPYLRVRGIDIYYEEQGSRDDPPLVVAHGLMGSIALSVRFGERPEALATRGLRVVSYDARGHGRSGYSTSQADYRWASLAEDLHEFIRALGLERASIYGGSMGAGTALMLALDHPDAVDKLVLRAPPPFGEQVRPARRLFGGLSYLYQFLGSGVTARIVTALPQAHQAQRMNPSNDMRSFFASQRREAVVPAIRGLLGSKPQLPTQRFGEITQPALVLTHPNDVIHPLASGELLHDRMPHARLAVAPTTTYWQEHADELADVVASFVRGEPHRSSALSSATAASGLAGRLD
jgi:pimeloyl-ACP methyl ester carboxylesterase